MALSTTLMSKLFSKVTKIHGGLIVQLFRNLVVWGDKMDEMTDEIWAEGQPDGPTSGDIRDIEFCVAAQKPHISGRLPKLHDKLCKTKMAVVCQIASPLFEHV